MFQNDFGPPKHVLHLVWSVLGISTAIKIALNVALYDCFDGPLSPLNGQFMEKVTIKKRTKIVKVQISSKKSEAILGENQKLEFSDFGQKS